MPTATKSNRVTAIGGESPTNGAKTAIEAGIPYVAEITIQGTADFLFHRWNCEAVKEKGDAPKGSDIKKSDDLESYVYRNDKNELCIPGEYLRMAILGAAKFSQDPRSSRKSAQDLFKAAIIAISNLAGTGLQVWDYEDKRRVVIQKGSAVTRTRPALKAGWTITVQLQCNLPEYISPQFLNQVIQQAGKLIGIGDFRPTFGRFQVVKFDLIDL